jgi:hypothetical protein
MRLRERERGRERNCQWSRVSPMRSKGHGSRLATAGLALARFRARHRAERLKGGDVARHRRTNDQRENANVRAGARHGTSA